MCTLRAYGKAFAVDRFLEQWPWEASGIFHRGQMRGKRKITVSSFNMGISDASWKDLAAQVRDATKFIQKNEGQLRRLKQYPGVEGVSLDFPVESKLSSIIWTQEESFSDMFIQLAGKTELAITLSIYPESKTKSRVSRNKKNRG